jgi:hypothetical protein
MKIILSLLAVIFTSYSFGQSTIIPDSNFEQALIDANIDSDGLNGSILNSDAQQIIGQLDVSYRNIDDLTGIEAFINIETLDCRGNNLTTLNLSQNTQLIAFSASYNNLTDINLNNIQSLQSIDINNNQLDSLDCSSHPQLYYLMCYTNNLTFLNIENNTNLAYLSCGENQLSGNLDISHLFDLEFFACIQNQLTSINVGFHGVMTSFNCRDNNIEELDFSSCFALQQLYVDSNNLNYLNLRNNSNDILNLFESVVNPNLYCIQVDNSAYSTSNPNWSEDAQSFYSEDCASVGISDLEYSEFKIIPNPAADWIHIEIDNADNMPIVLSDLNGKILLRQTLSENEPSIDIRNLSNGIYLVKIGQTINRFVKN